MEVFKLGLMTQKHHNELLQAFDELRMSIETLTKEIAKLNSQVVESHTDLSNKISTLKEETTTNHATINEKISALTIEITNNHATLMKKFSTLSNQTTADNRIVKESLNNVEELLRLTAMNQIMNLVEK